MHHWATQLAEDYLPDGWERVSSSAFTKVAVNREQQLYYKEFLPRSPADAMKAIASGSRATKARINADALLLTGIDAPESVHWGSLPGGREYLYTIAAPGERVDYWLRQTLADRAGTALLTRRQLLRALGTFIGRVHATGFIHGDLRPGNVLAAQLADNFRFTLLGNQNNTRKNPTPGKLLLRNLVQLNMLPLADLSRTDRMRFFRAWRRQMRDVSEIEAKILAAEAYQVAMRRQEQQLPG